MSKVTDIARGTHLSISALSVEFGMTRDTVRKRLVDAKVKPSGKRGGWPVYRLKDVLPALLGNGDIMDPDQMDPYKRKAHYQSESEKLELEKRRGLLIPSIEHEQGLAHMAKILAECFDTLPDLVERDCGLQPHVVARIEERCDQAREDVYQRLIESTESDDEDAERPVREQG